ncbi:MAG: hypothetical protein JKY53_14690 [Flavobacteriales bacterium]|nr:hypothetical protein [Flavobacteriales bacterium]
MISKKAKLNETATVGHYVFIEDGVEIGAGTVIKNFVEIRNNVIIGDNCIIESHTIIDSGATIRNKTGIEPFSHVKGSIGPGIYGGVPLQERRWKGDYVKIINPTCFE